MKMSFDAIHPTLIACQPDSHDLRRADDPLPIPHLLIKTNDLIDCSDYSFCFSRLFQIGFDIIHSQRAANGDCPSFGLDEAAQRRPIAEVARLRNISWTPVVVDGEREKQNAIETCDQN